MNQGHSNGAVWTKGLLTSRATSPVCLQGGFCIRIHAGGRLSALKASQIRSVGRVGMEWGGRCRDDGAIGCAIGGDGAANNWCIHQTIFRTVPR